MVSFFERLRDERQRLGLSQTELAEAGGVTKKTQGLYERGDRSPSADYLMAVSTVGMDLPYLLSGNRLVSLCSSNTSSDELISEAVPCHELDVGLSSLGNQQRDLVTQLISALSEKPQPGFSAEAVRKMVMTVQEIMLEERMQLTPEEVADTVINCLQQAARPDRAGVTRQLRVVK